MKELQAKAKVTQTMTRDGLVVENQADGTVENVSSREAEQDYSTDAEGKAEKILERAEDIKDGHENKKKAKKAAETAATISGAIVCLATGSAGRGSAAVSAFCRPPRSAMLMSLVRAMRQISPKNTVPMPITHTNRLP